MKKIIRICCTFVTNASTVFAAAALPPVAAVGERNERSTPFGRNGARRSSLQKNGCVAEPKKRSVVGRLAKAGSW